ncbi:ABC transporter ATP-binding protein [Abyssisolibacter fermentans]|uniref:ABC transporter ATP-binding protein n=1 Tax=Abyssisolibacter fermentans TaxID=1766203 RepID=UPI0008344232|nr:ABC transporter ATP-binding protein [Abyssisolibacter fermentans]
MQKVVEMKNITKEFPGVKANDNINFSLNKGEIHVLLGENGAGKTTLMNILYGLYEPTSGEIFINEKKVVMKNPTTAIQNGIGMVHQHFMLVPPFTIAENIILGSEPSLYNGLKLDMNKAIEQVKSISNKYGLAVDPYAKVQDISVGMQQRVEILKALYRGAEILILDEPTAVLTPQEIDDLGKILNKLTDQGKSVILITHKLKEVMSMSNRVTIVRRGKIIDTVETEKTTSDKLAELMVGRKVNLAVNKEEKKAGATVLRVDNLKVEDNRGVEKVKEIDFEVKAGEVFAIAGVDGNGQTELVEALTGLRKAKKGKITLENNDITNIKTRRIIEAGVGHVPEDRHKRGLVLEYSLAENMILGNHYKKPFSKNGILNNDVIHKHAVDLIGEFDVRTPNEDVKAKSLSGGNQQKVIIAREFNRNPALLIASQPTRGLDVGAIEFVHKRIINQRNNGKAVLLVSLELDEVLTLADRIGVIYDGKIIGILDAKDATEKELGIMMAGGKSK